MVTYRKATAAAEATQDAEATEAQPATFTVGNTPGAKLPSTGGMGTTVFYATGVGLMMLAAIWFVMDQKRKVYRSDI